MLARQQDRHWGDFGIALLLAGLLTLGWTIQGWAELSVLRLPDTDDVVRLQQIRDWLAGQAFGDLAQHRLGPVAGLEMHWSRLPDLVPAAVIVLLSPLVGAHAAEVAAVILWPAMCFAATLARLAAIARAVGTSGSSAALVAALAYPATTLFLPGRIDHHGLQMVLLLVVVHAAVARGTFKAGVGAGIATVAAVVVGIEAAPLLAICGVAIVLRWVQDTGEGQPRLAGYAAALCLGLAVSSVLLRTSGWSWPGCDGFTAEVWRAAQFGALGPLALAAFGLAKPRRRTRQIATLLTTTVVLFGALALAPGCVTPYGAVSPVLSELWLANVAEARPLLRAPLADAIGYAGVMVAGIAATAWVWRRTCDDKWLILLALQLTALALTCVQLRGAYAGALLATPALAALIVAARTKGLRMLVPAWLLSAGLLYPLAGAALAPGTAVVAPESSCTGPAALTGLAALPTGTLMAPIDLGAWALAATPHHPIAGPYHRNEAGNLAMYRFFVGPIENAEAIAKQWHVRYVAFCPNDFEELTKATRAPGGLSDALRAGTPPAWLRLRSISGEAPALYDVVAGKPLR